MYLIHWCRGPLCALAFEAGDLVLFKVRLAPFPVEKVHPFGRDPKLGDDVSRRCE